MIVAIGVVLVVFLVIVACRCYWISTKVDKRTGRCKVLAVLGSGGHTTEMLRLLSGLSERYQPIEYVIGESDKFSMEKCRRFEEERAKQSPRQHSFHHIVRSREVGQSWLSSFFSTVAACVAAVPTICRLKPDLVLCNGPGTCIPLCGIAYIYKILGIRSCRIVYVESLCRVESLSLSAKLLYWLRIANDLLVQWPELQKKYPRTKYIGLLV
ncbi:UDP-N-acetylglucosamine transferase subunit ALG14 homolog [Corticium candelabrum]|uniref:UDP-N-acetylglucosamine transferase subunit ALG14 homolog n=1 Tax=Corticium candelabrum TaxID=121492 RepID=UPI002E26583D|nr:UDP-N-acetylglucosamine transferase subunit ALG14 homolog [Corticium candelabrum]